MRVLIVEDEVLIALELESLIEDLGHEVVGLAATAREAVELGRSLSPDVAFVDVHLADGATGVEAAGALASSGETLVLFMTANAKRIPDDFVGALGVIAKPYTERGVRHALDYVSRLRDGRPGPAPDGLLLAPREAERRERPSAPAMDGGVRRPWPAP